MEVLGIQKKAWKDGDADFKGTGAREAKPPCPPLGLNSTVASLTVRLQYCTSDLINDLL